MYKRIIIYLFTTFYGGTLLAQNEVGCESLLQDAREAYDGGMVELVPDILGKCLESGLSGTKLQDAYKLVINAYLFDYLPEDATTKMKDFITKFPEYTPTGSDTREFIQLHTSVQEEMDDAAVEAANVEALEVEARREAERQKELERQEQIRRQQQEAQKDRKPDKERERVQGDVVGAYHSLGLTAGTILLFPGIVERYSMTDPAIDQGAFSKAVPGIRAGFVFNLNLSNNLNLGIGLGYDRAHLVFNGKPYPFTGYQYDEYQHRMHLPVSLGVDLNPGNNAVVYFKFGGSADLLLGASASAVRSYDESGDEYYKPVEVSRITITDARSRMNVYGLGGVGFKYKYNSGFFFLEATYNYGFLMSNKGEKRYDYPDLNWQIYHVDSDYKTSYLALTVGLAWKL
jgi:hypothetical protein